MMILRSESNLPVRESLTECQPIQSERDFGRGFAFFDSRGMRSSVRTSEVAAVQLTQACSTTKALRVAPDSGLVYSSLFEVYVAANRIDEAKAVYKDASARAPADLGLRTSMYGLAFLMGDQPEMDRQSVQPINPNIKH